IYLAVVNVILSLTAILGNFLILVTLRKQFSLHPPSKLLYGCLATTDLLVGLVSQPLYAIYWISIANEHWNLCRYTRDAASITGYSLCGVSLGTNDVEDGHNCSESTKLDGNYFVQVVTLCNVTYRISSIYKQWNLCRYSRSAGYLSSYALCGVSLLTMTTISVDRLLALLLGLRYKRIVTLKRTYVIVATVWVSSGVAALCYILNKRIVFWFLYIIVPLCLVISIAAYTKIFHTLHYNKARVQQQSSQPNSLNILRYRKAVHSALSVQLALVVCYAPYIIVESVTARRKTLSSHIVVIRGTVVALLYFNSTLNPFLYCWKISEVRKAVKQTIRQSLCSS
ncbi:melanocortin receptor 5-like, partial [Pocillopora damicornis]|uniref:melanocortin receptor 5-like n=1 Tax=Pocillopora damicornis TaxID=46731 RepID=UPI000F54CEE6